jgi:hypothetical protein
MEEVDVAAALAAGIVLVVIVSVLVRRRGSGETQSVAGYRRALDVLGQVAEGEHRPRQTGPGGQRAVPADQRAVPADQRAVPAERTSRSVPPQFDDVGTEMGQRRGAAAPGQRLARRDRSLLVMERPARRIGPSLAVLAVVAAAGGGAAYVVVRAHHTTRPPKQATTTSARRHTRHEPTKHERTTRGKATTTSPSRYLAASSTGSSATYAPATSTYSLTVGASTGACWMSVTSASGKMVLAQTFAPGASATVTLTGDATILLGAPKAARLSIDGAPVVLPSATAVPYTITLLPA